MAGFSLENSRRGARRRRRRPPSAAGAQVESKRKRAPVARAGDARIATKPSSARVAKRRTQAERSARSHKGLLGAALELIAERGFRASSLQAIGDRAGYSRGLVSARFGSKEGLLRELVTRMVDRWGSEVRDPAVGARTGVRALAAIAGVHREAIERTPDAVRALYMLLFESLVDMPDLRREMGRLDRRLREGTERVLRRGIKSGAVRADVDASAQAVLFLAVLRGITLQWLVDPNALDLVRIYRELDAWLTRGVGR
jgi:AcrR family transcriptional regulator